MSRKQPAQAEAACRTPGDGCCTRTPLADRPLLSFFGAATVMGTDTRVRPLHHLLRSGEATVTELAKTLGMKPQAVSNQLGRLSDIGITRPSRDGNDKDYQVASGCVAPLLDLVLCLMEDEGESHATNGGHDVQANRGTRQGPIRGGGREHAHQ